MNFRVERFKINIITNLLVFVGQFIDELRDVEGILTSRLFFYR